MTAEMVFLDRAVQPGFRDLHDVVLLGPVMAMTGTTAEAGTEG